MGKEQTSIGLDIGFHDIKIVELVRNEEGFQITKFAIREIPAAILQQKDRAGLLGGMIKKCSPKPRSKAQRFTFLSPAIMSSSVTPHFLRCLLKN